MPTNTVQISARPRALSPVMAVLAALIMALGFSLATSSGAIAHDQIISSNPSPQAQLDAAPGNVELLFSGSLMELGNEVRIMDAADKDWAQGKPVLSGEKLTQPIQANMPDGEYMVRWRVVSSDGHPINGTQTFVVGDAPTVDTPAAAPSSQAANNSGAASANEQAEDSAQGGSNLAPVLVIAGGAIIGLGAYVAFIFIARARKNAK